MESVNTLLQRGAAHDVAIAAPGRPPLSYSGLRTHVERVVDWLSGFGIRRGDRLAIVLPNGPEMATTFVSIAAAATTAPLNPAYREAEFEFYLSDLRARALVVAASEESPARTVAARLGLDIIELSAPPGAPAGVFDLSAREPSKHTPVPHPPGASDDVALLLHTSGTTARPKLVPLSHANLAASARHVREALALNPGDRCLNIMPLFHIHGLVASLLATLSAGGSIVCTPGFNALKFFSWITETHPTWYTAVPTMHQMILARAGRQDHLGGQHRFRFIRSCSAALPPRVLTELESAFGAPVIESYGMTEAAHQMTSNPLPPRTHKPGTVGVPAGPEVAVMDLNGKLLGARQAGEVVIRGPNVFAGYEDNPLANEQAFADGWFRTGDQGFFDDDGYLTISGRLKELINRGGEKISPREIDEVLLDHPAVAQAVAFAVPHEKLGEDVAAAVVLRPGASATPEELRAFAAERIADFKVPRQVLIVDEIPKGPTGKLQRVGLAAKLGIS